MNEAKIVEQGKIPNDSKKFWRICAIIFLVLQLCIFISLCHIAVNFDSVVFGNEHPRFNKINISQR